MFFNTKINYDIPCDKFKDCYNCTIANCLWEKDKCSGVAKEEKGIQPTQKTLENLFEHGLRCQGQMKICKDQYELGKDKLRHYTIYFGQKDIPSNYFCVIEYKSLYSIISVEDVHEIANVIIWDPYTRAIILFYEYTTKESPLPIKNL